MDTNTNKNNFVGQARVVVSAFLNYKSNGQTFLKDNVIGVFESADVQFVQSEEVQVSTTTRGDLSSRSDLGILEIMITPDIFNEEMFQLVATQDSGPIEIVDRFSGKSTSDGDIILPTEVTRVIKVSPEAQFSFDTVTKQVTGLDPTTDYNIDYGMKTVNSTNGKLSYKGSSYFSLSITNDKGTLHMKAPRCSLSNIPTLGFGTNQASSGSYVFTVIEKEVFMARK